MCCIDFVLVLLLHRYSIVLNLFFQRLHFFCLFSLPLLCFSYFPFSLFLFSSKSSEVSSHFSGYKLSVSQCVSSCSEIWRLPFCYSLSLSHSLSHAHALMHARTYTFIHTQTFLNRSVCFPFFFFFFHFWNLQRKRMMLGTWMWQCQTWSILPRSWARCQRGWRTTRCSWQQPSHTWKYVIATMVHSLEPGSFKRHAVKLWNCNVSLSVLLREWLVYLATWK